MVSEFTKRSLTGGTDQLPALSGVASVMHSALGSDSSTSYLAGLWSHDLAYRDTRIELRREAAGSITYIQDISWEMVLFSKDPYSRVAGGTLTFLGLIKE